MKVFGMKDLVVNRHALPDWYRCQSIAFVYPYKVKDREHLIPFYDNLLSIVPHDVGITLVVRDASFTNAYSKKCHEKGITNQINFIEIPDITDIWIRDFAPITIIEGGLKTALQFEYAPSYVDKKHQKYLLQDHQAGETLWMKLKGYGVGSMYFKWDMGNLTHNGNGTAIVTNRLIADNQNVNIEHELKPMLHVFTGFKNIHFIPTEHEDRTGHVDGMVRFIDEKVLVVGSYPRGVENHNLMDKVAEELKQDLGSEFTVLRLENGIPEDFEYEGIGSAYGNHINFLRINDNILFPYYSDEVSKKPMHDLVSNLKHNHININVIPVNIPEIKDLARLGGVLNCISWQVF